MHNCLTSRVNIDVFSNYFSGNEKINWSNWLFLWEVLTCINYHQMHCMVYICVCPSTRACFTHLETLSLTVKNYKFFDLYSALLAIEQCGISNVNVPHLLWHGLTLDNGHIQRPVTLTPVGESLVVELSKPVLTI